MFWEGRVKCYFCQSPDHLQDLQPLKLKSITCGGGVCQGSSVYLFACLISCKFTPGFPLIPYSLKQSHYCTCSLTLRNGILRSICEGRKSIQSENLQILFADRFVCSFPLIYLFNHLFISILIHVDLSWILIIR